MIRMSQAMAISVPPPKAYPFKTAMTGTGSADRRPNIPCMRLLMPIPSS